MDQHTIFLEQIPVSFDLEAVARKLRIQPKQTTAMDKLAKLAREAETIAHPKAVARLCELNVLSENEVQVGGVVLTSPLLCENMGGLGRVFPYLATEGTELAEWSNALESSLEQVFACALREAVVKQYERLLEKQLLEQYGINQVSAMNPGSLEIWPITQQEALFQILASFPEQFDVVLLPSFMMKPEYSISGIFFQTDKKYYNCQLCPRENCPNRKAPRL